MKDRFLLGAAAGAVGGTVMGILHMLLSQLPGVSLKMIYGVSRLFVPGERLGTLESSLIGGLASIVCASIIGIIIMTATEITGTDYFLIKGALLGIMTWFITCGLLGQALRLNMQETLWDNLLIMLIHAVYGVIVVWFIKKYRIKV